MQEFVFIVLQFNQNMHRTPDAKHAYMCAGVDELALVAGCMELVTAEKCKHETSNIKFSNLKTCVTFKTCRYPSRQDADKRASVPLSVTAACGRLLELETSIFTRARSDLRTCADLNT